MLQTLDVKRGKKKNARKNEALDFIGRDGEEGGGAEGTGTDDT